MKSQQLDDIYDWYAQKKSDIYEKCAGEKWTEKKLADKIQDLDQDFYSRLAKVRGG